MTDKERQEQMDFILDALAPLTAITIQLAESQAKILTESVHDRRHITELEKSVRETEKKVGKK